MNLLLHGIGDEEHESPIVVDDALKADPGERFEMVLTNPPFGRKSSMTFVSDEGEVASEDLVVVRDDFWASTSNKQLNFVQHVKTLLAINGRAAVVVPDNVLFEGGAGETVRRRLLDECDVHTLLRLPTGVFYAQGVKANVLFFDRKPAAETPWTRELWVYDLRTNMHFTLKQNPLRYEHLQDFIAAYSPDDRSAREESERFRRFGYDELVARDKASLDITWLRDDSLEDTENLPAARGDRAGDHRGPRGGAHRVRGGRRGPWSRRGRSHSIGVLRAASRMPIDDPWPAARPSRTSCWTASGSDCVPRTAARRSSLPSARRSSPGANSVRGRSSASLRVFAPTAVASLPASRSMRRSPSTPAPGRPGRPTRALSRCMPTKVIFVQR